MEKQLHSLLQDDQVELEFLQQLPDCFLIVGKPGSGKTTLAKNFSSLWNCCLISDTTVLQEMISEESDLGIKAKSVLESGEEVTEEFMADMIMQKLKSPSIQNYGYVLDCLPCMCEGWRTIQSQIDFIKSLPRHPTVIINLKMTDLELEQRRLNFGIDPENHKLYLRQATNPVQLDLDTSDSDDGSNTQNESDDDIFASDLGTIIEKGIYSDSSNPLVQRPRDIEINMEKELMFFNDIALKPLEDFIVQHNRQFVIDLDANLSPKDLLKSLLIHLDALGISRCPVPQPLFDIEDEEEDTEGMDADQFMKKVCDSKNILPKFRWRSSKWGRYCPVQVARGNLVPGKLEYSAGFLDKAYCLSSAEALKEFIVNPRFYLLPPYPCLPCKVCILGPPTSGKSTLSKLLAEHYGAMVLNIQQLLIPVITKQKVKLVENAQQDAINNFMSEHANDDDISETDVRSHPDVVRAVKEATAMVDTSSITITQDMYMEALKEGIDMAEEKKREKNPTGPKFGGWIIDSFPMTRDNWLAMTENDLIPDFVISLEDEEAPEDFLLSRFTNLHKLPSNTTEKNVIEGNKEEKEEEGPSVKVSELVTKWKNGKAEYSQQWNQLIASIKGSAIDPVVIDCTLPVDTVLSTAISLMEGIFSHKPMEYSYADEDADADDDPNLNIDIEDAEIEDVSSNDTSRNSKPWGESRQFCPVLLQEQNILCPGHSEILLRYREKIYSFSSEEAKEKFLSDPLTYCNTTSKFEIPPLRCFILGGKSSGKTIIGRHLAKKFGVFHISFRELLQEEILAKMKKPPLIDADEWEDTGNDLQQMSDDSELDPDVKVPLTVEEAEIRSYLLNENTLSEELMQQFLQPFWLEEPYRSTGFVLEGFPSKSDEMRYLAENKWFPDVVIILQVEESHVISRILPKRMEVWNRKRNERIAKAKQRREALLLEWENDKMQRKAEINAEYNRKVAANTSSDSNDDDESPDVHHDEYLEQLAEINDEEPPEIEEDEEEESEIEAIERMKSSIIEQFEEQIELISLLQDVFVELQVPFTSINGCRKPSVVKFSVEKCLLPYTVNRQGLLTKSTPVNAEIAKKLLDHGYKYLSPFKKWCPIELQNDIHGILPPSSLLKSKQFPVIYRQHIYFPSSSSNRILFIENPHKFISQLPPGPAVRVTLAIVGPPKSGKTAISRRFCDEYGCIRLSIGEVLRRVISKFPQSKLTELIEHHLKSGQTVPDDLCIYALESALLDVQCSTRGFVLDGWPSTKLQVDLLNKFHIIPVCIVELKISEDEVLERGKKDKLSVDRTYPVHDSDSILLLKSKCYYDNIESIKNWYINEHDNWNVIDGANSKWKVFNECKNAALYPAKQIQQYLLRTMKDKAASIDGLCVTPSDFKCNLGEFSEYCPVNLALHGDLVDCSTFKSLKFAASYRGKYYKMNTYEDLQLFLTNPDSFVLPEAPYQLPSTSKLPQKKLNVDIKSLFPKKFEANGFCLVCYIDGGKLYDNLRPGNPEFSALYCDKLHCFCSETHLEKFLRKPHVYEVLTLPSKLPPLKQALPVTSLPMLGYMEQAVATAIIESLSAAGSFKPKFPFFSSTKSALYYVGLYLKAFNPKTNKLIRQKYKKKLAKFEDQCKLIDYLCLNMSSGYKEPLQRPLEFDRQINNFMCLKNHTEI